MDGARISLPFKSIQPDPWEDLLGEYYDKQELVQALRYGWDLSFLPQPTPKDATYNLPSAIRSSILKRIFYLLNFCQCPCFIWNAKIFSMF
jgi:hypothetical protein